MSDYSALDSVWNSAEGKYGRIPGTEDWVTVAELGEGGYDWQEWKLFYSPSQMRYFWHGRSGCSCSNWDDDLSSSIDFENGDRADAIRAWERFTKEHSYSFDVSSYLDGVAKIKGFKEWFDVL